MKIKEWLKATKKHMVDRNNVLDEVGTTINYMRQLSGGHGQPGINFAKEFSAATKKFTPYAVVGLSDLRPDVWGEVEAA